MITGPASTKAAKTTGKRSHVSKAQKKRYAKCVRAARKHHGSKRHRAMARCARLKH